MSTPIPVSLCENKHNANTYTRTNRTQNLYIFHNWCINEIGLTLMLQGITNTHSIMFLLWLATIHACMWKSKVIIFLTYSFYTFCRDKFCLSMLHFEMCAQFFYYFEMCARVNEGVKKNNTPRNITGGIFRRKIMTSSSRIIEIFWRKKTQGHFSFHFKHEVYRPP